jgi:hypothetical protein
LKKFEQPSPKIENKNSTIENLTIEKCKKSNKKFGNNKLEVKYWVFKFCLSKKHEIGDEFF